MHQNQVGKPFATGCQGKFEKFAILTFTEEQLNIVLHLEIDNNTALSYLLKDSKSIWNYIFSKQIALSAEYLPSTLNVHADWESQNDMDNSEWIDVSVFKRLQHTWDNQLWICLDPDSATNFHNTLHGNHTLGSIAKDAFLDPWDSEYGLTFPLFDLIS